MFTRSVILSYRCPECNGQETVIKHVKRSTIIDVTEHALDSGLIGGDKMRCFNCLSKEPMHLVYVKCELIDIFDEFGVPNKDIYKDISSHPFWECADDDTHIGERNPVYPLPLRRAYEGHIKKGVYKDIVDKGYPWRCPTCNGRLILR